MASHAPDIELLAELGQGATGRVQYGILRQKLSDSAGREWPAGCEIALKRLHEALVQDEKARAAFEAEIDVGRRVVHPGLVRVLHGELTPEGAYLVMQYIPGRTLREVLDEDGPLPEPLLRSVGAQISGALAALHEAGFQHGDIKPENVRLDAEGRAVLIDLGFARRTSMPSPLGRGTLAQQTEGGSLAYLAPEQARGLAGGPESDVFALGILLYELATGIHPFGAPRSGVPSGKRRLQPQLRDTGFSSGVALSTAGGSSQAERLLANLATANFIPPSRLVPQASPFLDALLQEMLQRELRARPTSAETERRFSEGEDSQWWRATIDFSPRARRGPQADVNSLHLLPLIGRGEEMQALLEHHRTVLESSRERPLPHGNCHAVWIEGPEGIGKSRLISDFAARARAVSSPPLYLYGRCRELDDARPCGTVLRMLERYLLLPPGTPPVERERAWLAGLVARAPLQALLSALDPAREGEAESLLPEALADWLVALGRRGPLLAFVDDIQHADDGTLSVLERLLPRLPGTHIQLVLGHCPVATQENEGGGERLARLIHGLEEGASILKIALAPLRERDVEALVDALFHPSAPRLRIADTLFSRTQGNPGFLREILGILLARGMIEAHRSADHRWVLLIPPEKLPAPSSLQESIAQRYAALPAQDRIWLQRLTVVGGRMHPDFLVRAFSPTTRAEVDGVLARLSRAEWITSAGSGYRFSRPGLRHALYRSIPKKRRARLHAVAAKALRPGPGGRMSVPDAFQLAFHLHHAMQSKELLRVLKPLVDHLLRRGQPHRVHTLSSWALEALDALPEGEVRHKERLVFLEAAADAADRLGFRSEQRLWLDRLSDLDLDPERDRETLTRVYLLHGRYAVSTGQYGLARGMLRNAVELAGDPAERVPVALQSEALRRLSAVQAHVGALEEARAHAEQALESAQTSFQKAITWLQIGVIAVLEDLVEPAFEATTRALKELREGAARGDHGGRNLAGALAAVHLLRGRIYRLAGRPRRALGSLSRAVRLARAAGERRLEIECTARLGGLLLETNRAEQAEAQLREALLAANEIEDRRGQALAGLWLGVLLLERNDAEAGPLLARVERLAREMDLNRVEALALAIRARQALWTGDPAAAARHSSAAMALLEEHGAELADRIVIEGTRALILELEGRTEESEALSGALLRRLSRENARLKNPIWQQRHRQATFRLAESILSPEGPVYPRIDLPWARAPLVPPLRTSLGAPS
jgi:serine/threonine protein kinase/tetratricopeptide (TPR) repeat protein